MNGYCACFFMNLKNDQLQKAAVTNFRTTKSDEILWQRVTNIVQNGIRLSLFYNISLNEGKFDHDA